MIYDNSNQPENSQSISPDDIEALICALNHAAASKEAAYQPIIKALEQLAIAQATQETAIRISNEKMLQQTTQQQQKSEQQGREMSQEIEKLKQQIGLQNDRLDSLTDWRRVTAYIILSSIVTTAYIAILQKFLPPQLDNATLEKIDFLHTQEKQRIPKKKK